LGKKVGVEVNKSGVAYAKNLARRGKVDSDSVWTFDAADAERILGADGSDIGHFSKHHIGCSGAKDSKECFDFPFGKGGRVYRSAVIAAKDRATQDGNEEIVNAASEILEILEILDSATPTHNDGASEAVVRADFINYHDDRDWQTVKMERTPEGFLVGRAVATNIGVFPYQNADGTLRYELRHPDDVFDTESLASLNGKPLTNDHPMNGVDANSVQDLGVGTVHTPTHDAYHVTIGVVAQRQDAVAAIESGKIALSCGYNCDLVPERGNFHGTQYTHRQKNIRYNHVALVAEGRAGDAAKLRMDGAMPVQDSTTKTPTKGEHMAKVRLDSGTEFEVPEAVASHIDALTADRKKLLKSEEEVTDAKAKIKDLEGEMDAKKGELDSLKTQVDAWAAKYETSGKDTAAKILKAVDSRVGLLTKAVEVGAKVEDAHSDRDIQLAIIAMETADSMDGMSDEYVAARADGAFTHLKNHVPAAEPGGNSHSDGVLSGQANALATATRKRADALQNAWKGKE
jgi:hypothetical protein